MQWIYHQGATSFGDMHNFSKDLRQKLQAIASIDLPEVTSHEVTQRMVLLSGLLSLVKKIILKQFIFLKKIEVLCVSPHKLAVRLLVLFVQQDIKGFNRNLKES